MEVLIEYMRLIYSYNTLIRSRQWQNNPDRESVRGELVKQMDKVWVKLSKEQREKAIDYVEVIYKRALR